MPDCPSASSLSRLLIFIFELGFFENRDEPVRAGDVFQLQQRIYGYGYDIGVGDDWMVGSSS